MSSPEIFTRELLFSLDPQIEDKWLKEWTSADALCKQNLAELFSANTSVTEPGLIWEIASFLTKDWSLFLANSMPIRDANQFFFGRCRQIYANRGVSGIDGNIATLCGLAQGSQKPILAVIGDQTFLHDLNSLAMLAKTSFPVVLCVVNNSGGGIFSFLPIAERKEAFEELFAASHDHTFASAAELFGIPYFHPQTPAEFGDLLFHQKKNPHSCIIEITTDRTANVHVHEQIIASLGTCLNSANSPVEIPASLH
ncbi:MAG: hypothetical protein HYX67_08445 [Candidatus Melainabacteria bacterium]|nr:hypothetical protein [Candidatus Melainabacteria bacterium]